MINFDKFLASFITEIKKYHAITGYSIPSCIKKALEDQGLAYKDGEIIKTQRRISAEAKETGYGESDDERIRDVRRRSTIQVLEYARSLDTYNQYGKADIDKNIAWLEKQGEQKPYCQREECLDCQFNYAGECKGSCAIKRGEQKSALDIEIPFGAKDSELQEVSYYIPEGFHAEIEGDKVVIKKGKQIKEVDLEKEIQDWVKTGPHTSYPWCTIPDAIRITAEHFFELGINAQKGE